MTFLENTLENDFVLSKDLLQNITLSITTSNISQRKNRQQLIAEHKRLESYSNEDEQFIRNICSQTELTPNLQLRLKISIVDLQVDNVPTERFLLCRVIAKWIKLSALITLVEDPEGNVERLALYNMILGSDITKKDESNLLFTNQFLPEGTQLVIKNPSYKIAADGNTMIRSDNPEEVIVIGHVNKLFSDLKWSTDLKAKDMSERSNDDFRRCGNDYFVLNDYKTAIDEYSGGIKLEPQNVKLLTNRAMAYLELHQFDKALADVEIALKGEPDNIKAAYRKVKALCGLKRYQEALVIIRDLHKRVKANNSNNNASFKRSAGELLKHVKMLVAENKNGHYDYTNIIYEFCEKAKINEDGKGWVYKDGPRLDHAEFLIDAIEISPVKGKGRGWIAKHYIPENTLLMVSKAFKIVFGINKDNNYLEELMTSTAQSLMDEPDRHRDVYQLYCGPDLEKLDNRMVRIGNIIKYNTFWAHYDITELSNFDGAGLWVLPSYFNHSCVDANIYQFFLGDLMFIRTLRPISKGEELVLNYSLIYNHDYERRSKFLKSVGIDCKCRLCELDRSETEKTKLRRVQLLETYEKSIKPKLTLIVEPSTIKELEGVIAELRSLRKDHPDLEFDSIKLMVDLGSAYRNNRDQINIKILKETYDFSKKVRWISDTKRISLAILFYYFSHLQMNEGTKWFDISLKDHVEPIRGKFKKNEADWREESMIMIKKLIPEENFPMFL